MSQLELYKSLWSVKLYRLSGLHSSDENAVQKVTVIINIRLVQRSPKCVTIQRVTLQPMRPKSQHASHCNFHRRNNCRVIHASLFAIRFIALFFQDKEFWRGATSPPLCKGSACAREAVNLCINALFSQRNININIKPLPGLLSMPHRKLEPKEAELGVWKRSRTP